MMYSEEPEGMEPSEETEKENKQLETASAKGRRGRRSKWTKEGDDPLCQQIIAYWKAHPDKKPREIARALGINNGRGEYVSQVLYRHRYLEKAKLLEEMRQKQEVYKRDQSTKQKEKIEEYLVKPEEKHISDPDIPVDLDEGERKRLVLEAVEYIIQSLSQTKLGYQPAVSLQTNHKESNKIVPFEGANSHKDQNEEYQRLVNLLGILMLYWLHHKMIDKKLVRFHLFNTVGIRKEDDYDLFMRVVYDTESWLYSSEFLSNTPIVKMNHG